MNLGHQLENCRVCEWVLDGAPARPLCLIHLWMDTPEFHVHVTKHSEAHCQGGSLTMSDSKGIAGVQNCYIATIGRKEQLWKHFTGLEAVYMCILPPFSKPLSFLKNNKCASLTRFQPLGDHSRRSSCLHDSPPTCLGRVILCVQEHAGLLQDLWGAP